MKKSHIIAAIAYLMMNGIVFGAAPSLPGGYGSITWGTLLKDAKNKIVGKIAYTDDKKVIISRDEYIEYEYGFFYEEPDDPKKTSTTAAPTGKLFFVIIRFPFLSVEKLMEKMKPYGEPTGQTVKDNQGAIIWESDKTQVILWVDEYEKKPYCRKLTYVSREWSKKVTEYQEKVFTKEEIKRLNSFKP